MHFFIVYGLIYCGLLTLLPHIILQYDHMHAWPLNFFLLFVWNFDDAGVEAPPTAAALWAWAVKPIRQQQKDTFCFHPSTSLNPCHTPVTSLPLWLWLQPTHNAPLLSKPDVCSMWWGKGGKLRMDGGVKGGLWGFRVKVVGWRERLLHEQEVLSVPPNLESGLGEQTEGERAYWRTRLTPSCSYK